MTQNVLRGQATLTRYANPHRGKGSSQAYAGLVCLPDQAYIAKTNNSVDAAPGRAVLHIHAGERLYDLGWRRNFQRIVLSHPLFREVPQT